jgi:4-amino-4-deoxy-L-arabinose transferase-like glycosyltransferase
MVLALDRARSRPGFFLLAGLLVGLAALTRPVAQGILPLFLLGILIVLPRWRPALRAAGVALVGYGLLIGPWTVRNLLAHETLSASGGLGRSLIARTVKYDTLFDWKWLSETYGEREDPDSRARMLLYRKRGNIPAGRSVRPYQDALIEELGLSQGQAEATMRDVALEAIARRPLEYVRGSLLFSGELFLGQEEPLRSHWKQRANKDWAEQWDNRIDYLVTPLTPRQIEAQPFATTLTELYQPARVGWLLVLTFLLGCWFSLRIRKARPALLLAVVAVALLGLSAFLDGPVVRYRHPVDPLLSILAAGGLTEGLRAVASQLRRATDRGSQQDEQPAAVVAR